MPNPSPFLCGLLGRCPRCGKGRLFSGLMTIVPACPRCGLSMATQDSGDGPMFFALVIVGFLAVGGAAIVELRYTPPLWLHAVVWIPFTFFTTVAVMRFFKAWLIALQYKNRPGTFGE
jgi:uncharacterized protein (DUF983 family)